MANGNISNSIDNLTKKQLDKANVTSPKPSGKLSTAKKKEIEEEYKLRAKHENKLAKDKAKEKEKEQQKELAHIKKVAKEMSSPSKQLNDAINAFDSNPTIKNFGSIVGKSLKKSIKDAFGSREGESLGESYARNLNTAIGDFSKAITGSIDAYISAYDSYYSAIETRLNGSEKSFKSTSKILSNALTGNTAVSQLNVLKRLSDYVEKGIVYNVEQRAFLGEIAGKIATTFDAANGTLLQLVRVQQADSTAARLGMESMLNKFFNSTFMDTSYLSNLSDSVSSTILGANTQLSRNGSAEFEYVVQKWLGSLYSVGVSESAIQQIAQGINYLGTGDVSGLFANESLRNLMVMGANTANLDINSILTGGMNANIANKLLKGVITYTQQLANNSNQVVKSKYAEIFGMTISDLTALLNLSSKDLVNISNNMLTYSQAIGETESELNKASNRTRLSEKIQNSFNNTLGTIAEGIANSAGLYTTYLLNNMIMDHTGGGIEVPVPIPFVGTYELNLNKTIAAGIVGISALTKAGTILSGLAGNRALSLDNFGATATTGRGNGLRSTIADSNTGVGKTVSNTMYVGNADESAIYSSTLTSANESQEQVVGTTDESGNEMAESINNSIKPDVHSILEILQNWNSFGLNVNWTEV